MDGDLIREIRELTANSIGAPPPKEAVQARAGVSADANAEADANFDADFGEAPSIEQRTDIDGALEGYSDSDLNAAFERLMASRAASEAPAVDRAVPDPVPASAAAVANKMVGQPLPSPGSRSEPSGAAGLAPSDHFESESIPVVEFEHKSRGAGGAFSPILREKGPKK